MKTAAERMRKYRAKKKILRAIRDARYLMTDQEILKAIALAVNPVTPIPVTQPELVLVAA